VHANEKVVCWVTVIDSEPDVGRAPVQPSAAAHEVASVDDQVRVALPPAGTAVGFADKDTVGAGGGGGVSSSSDERWHAAITMQRLTTIHCRTRRSLTARSLQRNPDSHAARIAAKNNRVFVGFRRQETSLDALPVQSRM
jgi:hypothetical protein